MASNQRIDDLVSDKAFQQLEKLLSQLGIATERMDKFVQKASELNEAVGSSNGFKKLSDTVPKAEKAIQQMTDAEKEMIKVTSDIDSLLSKYGGTLRDNINVLVSQRKELASVQSELKLLKGQYAGSAQSIQALNTKTAQLTQKEIELKLAIAESTKVIKQQGRESQSAGGSTDQLSAKLLRLRTVYNSLTESERNNPAIGGKLLASINELDPAVKKIDAATGVYTRNVGNYFSKVFGAVRQLAYILPGLGIAGIFGLGIEGITALINAFDSLDKEQQKSIVSSKALSESIKSSSFTDAVKNVNELKINIKLAKDGFLDKNDVLKQYNETIGQTTGYVNTLDQAEQEIVKNGDKFIKIQLLKATAQNLLTKAADEAAKAAIEQARDVSRSIYGNNQEQANAYEGVPFLTVLIDAFNQDNKALQKFQKDTVKTANDSSKLFTKLAEDLQKQAAAIAKSSGFNFFGDPGDSGKQKSELNDKLAIQKEILESVLSSEKSSYNERLTAIEVFQSKSNQIIASGEKNKELTQVQSSKLRLEIENKANQETLKLNKSAADKAVEGLKAYGKLIDQGLNERLKIQKAAGDQELADLAKNTQDQLNILADRYRKGELTEEQYQVERLNITGKYDELVLQSQIDNLKKLNSIREDDTNEDAERNKQAADLEIRLNKLINDRKIANDEKYAQTRLRLLKQIRDAEFKLGEDLIALGETLVNASFERANQELEAKSEQLNIDKENEVAAVERAVGSEEDKQARIALINEKYAQQQANLEKRQSEIRIRQAKFEKAFRALQVAINTFQKIAEIQAIAAVLLANPFTAALAPIALAQIPFVIGSGAAQAAAILATPIPAYKDGVRNKQYGSLSIYGEAGVEQVRIPGQKPFFTDGPTLGYLPAGTDVISNKELMAAMAKPEPIQYVGGQKVDLSSLAGEMKLTRKAIQNQNINTTVITKKGFAKQQRRVDQANNYKANRFK